MPKVLIGLLTYNRLPYLKFILPDYIKACRKNKYDLVVALDGNDDNYIQFCKENNIPLIFSDEREGVGFSKNRILKQFPDYDYYFFIEDDTELLNSKIFDKYIQIATAFKIHHLSAGEEKRFLNIVQDLPFNDETIRYAMYGSGAFNFFTKFGIQQVGGWHEHFAAIKRHGHTEHSFRFFHAGLSEAPFIMLRQASLKYIRWHNPASTINSGLMINENRLATIEQDLIDEKLTYFPIKTFSSFYYARESLPKLSWYGTKASIVIKLANNNWLTPTEKKQIFKSYLNQNTNPLSYITLKFLFAFADSSYSKGACLLRGKQYFINLFRLLVGKEIHYFDL